MILYRFKVNEDKHTINFINEREIIKIDKSIIEKQTLVLFKLINYTGGVIDLSQCETDDIIIACKFNKEFINVVIKYCLVVLFDVNYKHRHFNSLDEFKEKTVKYQINDCISQKFINRFDIEGEKKMIKPGTSAAVSRADSRGDSHAASQPETVPASKPISKSVSVIQTPRERKSNGSA